MRTLFGFLLGVAITIGGAYLYDSHKALAATSAGTAPEASLVNWDIAGQKWNVLSDQARVQWDRLTERVRIEWSQHVG